MLFSERPALWSSWGDKSVFSTWNWFSREPRARSNISKQKSGEGRWDSMTRRKKASEAKKLMAHDDFVWLFNLPDVYMCVLPHLEAAQGCQMADCWNVCHMPSIGAPSLLLMHQLPKVKPGILLKFNKTQQENDILWQPRGACTARAKGVPAEMPDSPPQ